MLMTQNCWVAASSRSLSLAFDPDRIECPATCIPWHGEFTRRSSGLYHFIRLPASEVHAIFINASHEMDGRRAPPRTAMMAGKRICPREERSVFDNVQVHGNLQLISRCRCVIESLKFRSKIIYKYTAGHFDWGSIKICADDDDLSFVHQTRPCRRARGR